MPYKMYLTKIQTQCIISSLLSPFSPTVHRNYTPWVSENKVLTTGTPNQGVVTVDTGGHVRMWETGRPQLSKSLSDWYKMIGSAEDAKLQVELDLGKCGHQSMSLEINFIFWPYTRLSPNLNSSCG